MNKEDKLEFVKKQLTEVIEKHSDNYPNIGKLSGAVESMDNVAEIELVCKVFEMADEKALKLINKNT